LQALLVYTSGVFGNSGNYKSFGDTKIIPDLPLNKLDILIQHAKFNSLGAEAISKWKIVRDSVYSLSERERQLGLGEKVIKFAVYFTNTIIMRLCRQTFNCVLFCYPPTGSNNIFLE
jgi:hypothetical protein